MNFQVMSLSDATFAATLLSFVAERLTEYFIVPIFEKLGIDKAFWTKYLVLIIGAALGVLAQVNFFGDMFINPWVGVGLSAAFVGGGSELIHQLIEALNRSNRPE